MNTFVTIIGLAAAVLTTVSFVPQVVKIAMTKSAKDVSFLMYLIISTALLLWLIYGIHRKDLPLMLSNSAALVLSVAVLALKVRYG